MVCHPPLSTCSSEDPQAKGKPHHVTRCLSRQPLLVEGKDMCAKIKEGKPSHLFWIWSLFCFSSQWQIWSKVYFAWSYLNDTVRKDQQFRAFQWYIRYIRRVNLHTLPRCELACVLLVYQMLNNVLPRFTSGAIERIECTPIHFRPELIWHKQCPSDSFTIFCTTLVSY